jgi:anti-sigma regulatory factor (Ser/Thr protein kinase)
VTGTLDHHHAGPATLGVLQDVHTLLADVWESAPYVGASERARFTLIVAELVANIIEHGCVDVAQPPNLELTVGVGSGVIRGTLIDDGAKPPRDAPGGRRLSQPAAHDGALPALSQVEVAALRESGRGLLLVRSVADDLALTTTAAQNRWRFAVRLRQSQPA